MKLVFITLFLQTFTCVRDLHFVKQLLLDVQLYKVDGYRMVATSRSDSDANWTLPWDHQLVDYSYFFTPLLPLREKTILSVSTFHHAMVQHATRHLPVAPTNRALKPISIHGIGSVRA